MSDSFFDSNVILYGYDNTDERKRQLSRQLIRSSLEERSGEISFQVVQEVLNTLNRKLNTQIRPASMRRVLEDVLLPLWTVMPSQALYLEALNVHERYGYAFYDSLIIAAALEADADFLYSEDMQHGHQIEQTTIINPFL